MKAKSSTIVSAIKAVAIVALFMAGLLLLFCEEQDTAAGAFLLHFIADKGLAALALFTAHRLFKSDKFLAGICK